MADSEPITLLIESAREGNTEAAQRLWSSVYDEIRRIAQQAVDDEYGPSSVQATELAHEAYLRLAGSQSLGIESRSHLLATVARAIRRLLIDRVRARKAAKRGGELRRVMLDEILDVAANDSPELLDLDVALTELEAINARHAQLVELRFFGGMTLAEAAETLNISVRTAANDWAFARAWLRRRLESDITQ
jgi:RNA polymerase sigma-70 factor, ECF subfamily